MFGPAAAQIEHGIDLVLSKGAYSTKARALRSFRRFQGLAKREYGFVSPSNIQHIIEHFRNHVYTHRGNTVTVTADSDYRAFRGLVLDLIQIQFFPACIPPRPLNSNSPLLNETRTLKCLGTMDPHAWKADNQELSRTSLSALNDQEYLDQFFDHQQANRDEFLTLARDYIDKAYQRFMRGREFIAQVDPALFEDPCLLHPHAREPSKGLPYSLFSAELPENEGLRNLVAFLYYKRDGLIVRDFPGANNHLYRFGGRTALSEHLGLSSDLAAACAVVIVDETGINSESLYRLEFDPAHRTITPHDELDGYYFSYSKPRAGGPKNRLIRRGSERINAEFCFDLISCMTEMYREISAPDTRNQLFIHDGCSLAGEVQAMSATAFKNGIRRLTARSACSTFIEGLPNLTKLRVSRGLLEWHNSGGNPRAAARYLGNTVNVTINNYIPQELQEFFYRKQIRQFQHLLIAVSTDETPYQQRALDIKTSTELANYLESQVKESPLRARARASKVTEISADSPESESTTTFVLSIQNVAFLDAAKKNYMNGKSSLQNHCLKKWARFCGIVFSFIQAKGTRSQKAIMAEGISLNTSSPLQL